MKSLYNVYIATVNDKKYYIVAENMNEAAHDAANLDECCFSDYSWDTSNNSHWFTTQYGCIDVILFKEHLDKLSLLHEVIDYVSISDISKFWSARAKDDFITFQGKAEKSGSKDSFVSGAEELLNFISTSDFKNVKSLIEGAKDYIKK